MIKELEAKVDNNLTLNSVAGKLDIKPIKEKMKKLIELDHELNKRALNLIIFGLKEEVDKDILSIAQTELHNRLQIETTCLTKATRLGKLTKNKGRLMGDSMKVGNTFWPNLTMKTYFFTHVLDRSPQNAYMSCEF